MSCTKLLISDDSVVEALIMNTLRNGGVCFLVTSVVACKESADFRFRTKSAVFYASSYGYEQNKHPYREKKREDIT